MFSRITVIKLQIANYTFTGLYWTNPQFRVQLKSGGYVSSGQQQIVMVSLLQRPPPSESEGPQPRRAIGIDVYKVCRTFMITFYKFYWKYRFTGILQPHWQLNIADLSNDAPPNNQGPVLLTLLRHVARILANGRAAFFESCDAIGWNSCDVSQKR